MGYFGAGVGERIKTGAKHGEAMPPTAPAPKPLFAASLGAKPIAAAPSPTAQNAPQDLHARLCPLCQGETVRQVGLLICVGRCRARWLEDGAGRLIDVAALPFGVCECCDPRQALAGAAWGALCPKSGKGYLLLVGGPSPIETAAPHGVCVCCAPPAPLVWQANRLVCSRKPEREYARKRGEKSPEKKNIETQSALVEAIDAALKTNSAQLTVFGLFDVT